jgi:hypothetical protein
MKVQISRLALFVGALMFFGFTIDKFKSQPVYLNSLTGKVGATKKPNRFYDGCFCHSVDFQSPSSNVRVWITGKDTLRAGETSLYTLFIAKDTLVAAGFNVAAFSGILAVSDTLTRLENEELTHALPRFSNGRDTISWTFSYTAPNQAGRDTIYANACAVDTSYDPNGDFWNYAESRVVTVLPRLNAPLANEKIPPFALEQNYPNPFNPSTVIRYQLRAASEVKLELFDPLGRKVGTLVNSRQEAGVYAFNLNASTLNLSSGAYFYRLQSNAFSETKKMLYLK